MTSHVRFRFSSPRNGSCTVRLCQRCKPLPIPRVYIPIETYLLHARCMPVVPSAAELVDPFNDGSSNHDPRLILTRDDGSVHLAASTCTRGHVCQLQPASRASISQYRIGGLCSVDGAAPIRRPPALYETRRARDIALSMIIRHVNSIIRSTSILSRCAISLARSIRVGDPRLLRALD